MITIDHHADECVIWVKGESGSVIRTTFEDEDHPITKWAEEVLNLYGYCLMGVTPDGDPEQVEDGFQVNCSIEE